MDLATSSTMYDLVACLQSRHVSWWHSVIFSCNRCPNTFSASSQFTDFGVVFIFDQCLYIMHTHIEHKLLLELLKMHLLFKLIEIVIFRALLGKVLHAGYFVAMNLVVSSHL